MSLLSLPLNQCWQSIRIATNKRSCFCAEPPPSSPRSSFMSMLMGCHLTQLRKIHKISLLGKNLWSKIDKSQHSRGCFKISSNMTYFPLLWVKVLKYIFILWGKRLSNWTQNRPVWRKQRLHWVITLALILCPTTSGFSNGTLGPPYFLGFRLYE